MASMSVATATNSQHIQVVVRCRGLNEKEIKKSSTCVVECNERMREVTLTDRRTDTLSLARKTFTYDRVFGPHSKQQEIYNAVVRPVVMEVIDGYNCTIFAYGQTGTGKTFTMEGARSDDPAIAWEDDPLVGVIPRAVSHLFSALNAISNCEYSVKISYIELYNEELSDLLSESQDLNEKLRIFEDSNRKGSVVIPNLEEITVADKKEVYKILQKGAEKRQKASTQMNAQSSRSHSIFSVTVFIKEKSMYGEETLKVGKLNLVDLAGSENIERSGATGKRAAEAGKINKSLTTLGRVITALVEHRDHIPYRESNLTRLLQDSLGGKTKTTIIATISPAACNIDETLSTLDYAHKAKSIKNKPEANQKLVKKELIREYTDEIDKLKRELIATREKNGVFLPPDQHAKNEALVEAQKEEIRDLTTRLNYAQEEFEKLMCLFNETSDELASKTMCLKETKEKLSETEFALRITEQDRDENKYLLNERVKTETSLYQQAEQLLKTTQVSIIDCNLLHDTLNRKREIEALNKITNENYNQKIKNRYLAMIREESNDFACKSESLGLIITKLNDLKFKLSEDKEENCFELNSFISTLTHFYQAQKLYVSEFLIDKNSQFLAQFIDLNRLHLKKSQEFLHIFKNFMREHHFELTTIELNTLNDQIKGLAMYMTENQAKFRLLLNEIQQDSIDTLKKDLTTNVKSIDNLHESMRINADQINNFRCLTQAKKDKHDDDFNEIQELLNRKRQEHKQDYELIQLELDEAYAQIQSHRIRVKEIAEEMTTSMNNFVENFKNDMSEKLLSSFDEIINSSLAKLNQIASTQTTLDVKNEKIGVYVSSKFDEFSTHLQEDSKILEELGTNQHVTLDQNMKTQVETLSTQLKSSTKYLNDLTERYESEMNHVIESTDEPIRLAKHTNKKVKSFSEKLNEFMNENISLLETHMSKELKSDLATGQTPSRKSYDHPTQLTRTRNHTSLLELYREEQQMHKSRVAQESLASSSRSSSVESRKRNSNEALAQLHNTIDNKENASNIKTTLVSQQSIESIEPKFKVPKTIVNNKKTLSQKNT